jgi:ADP-heptose:LPS heptosyltransferase
MKKYLIFRTDRIGDFIVSCILINSIKRNENNSHITVVCSKKNYNYIKSVSLVDEAILYPENILERIKFYFYLKKKNFDVSLALDGKKKSIYSSLFSSPKKKFLNTTKLVYKFIFFPLFTKIFYIKDYKSRLDEIKSILKVLNFDYLQEDLNIFKNKDFFIKNNRNKHVLENSYNLLHFDEKWIDGQYIKKFNSIQPNINDLIIFLKKIISKTNLNLIISTGNIKTKYINELKNTFNIDQNKNYKIDFNGKKIYLLNNLSFIELKYIISKSKLIITCHGSPTHVASSMNVRIIDIYEEKSKEFYFFWNSHLRNYKFLYREKFKLLSKKIISLL